jgi:hypothetical protein
MRLPSLTTLIGDEIQGRDKWWDFVDGKDGFFYGIPSNARRRVVKFNPLLDKSLLTEIVGPDLGEGECKVVVWWGVVCEPTMAKSIARLLYSCDKV